MRNHIRRLLAILATFALVPVALAHNIPPTVGQFAVTTTGSFAICLNSSFTQEVACSTTGAVAVPLTLLVVGHVTAASDTACQTSVSTISDFPVDKSPPQVGATDHSVSTPISYDPSTGTGDISFISYVGGTCHGATFDPTGATEVSSGTAHFAISEEGKRIDFVITKLTDSIGGIGDFALYGVDHKQIQSQD
jgi:hypothetical protein